jgi:alpha-tubulin suppressor-like RCC1 family protein
MSSTPISSSSSSQAAARHELLRDLLSEKAKIKQILEKELDQHGDSNSFFIAADQNFLPSLIPAQIFETDRTYQFIDELFADIDRFVDHRKREQAQDTSEIHQLGKWVELSPNANNLSEIDTEKIQIPTRERIKGVLSQESLILSVFSADEYNFSSEFVLIYGGKFTMKRAYENNLAIIKKALKALDISLRDELCADFAAYVVDRVAWLFELRLELLNQALRTQFRTISALNCVKSIKISHIHVYLRRDEVTGELRVDVRCEDDAVLMDSKTKRPEADNLVKLVSYYGFPLTEDALSQFNEQQQWLLKKSSERSKRRGKAEQLLVQLAAEFAQAGRNYFLTPALLEAYNESRQRLARSSAVVAVDELDLAAPQQHRSDASFCAEVIAWGYDSYFSLGLGDQPARAQDQEEHIQDQIYEPRPLPLSRNIVVERIALIACSSRHTLLLTQFGSLYACGDNSEGALGLGDLLPRRSFALVDFPAADGLSGTRGKLTQIAAGCGALGAHSMAIDSNGFLYGWGFPKAVGQGNASTVNTPQRIRLPAALDTDGAEIEADGEEMARKVSCGDGFTICLTASGFVFSWGQWSHGRLGLGAIPQAPLLNRRSGGGKKLLKYQLKPARVLGVENAVDIACGEAHVLCALADGSLLAWGQNSLGQVGTGPARSGVLRDAFSPVLVPPFVARERREADSRRLFAREANARYQRLARSPGPAEDGEEVRAQRVFCGAFHSLCIDRGGHVWSWGSRGSPCLGHGDSPLLGEWSGKVTGLFSIATSDSERMVPFELLGWVLSWSMPRRVVALEGLDVVDVSAGDLHSAFLTAGGRLFLCGSGPLVPRFAPTSRVLDEEEVEGEETGGEVRDLSGDVVSSPRCPSASWLRELCTRHVSYAAGAGCRMFLVVDEELVAQRLTTELYRKLVSRGEGEDGVEGGDEESVHSHLSDFSSSRFGSILEARGKADCLVIASGHVFLCHKALLAQRSSELRNLIIMEGSVEAEDGGSLVQLLLPELNRDAARALFYFLYRDNLPMWAISSTPTLQALSRVGKSLRIPRLFLLAERFINVLTAAASESEAAAALRNNQPVDDLPPATLVRDLGSLLGDPEFADVRFIAESRAVAAHRFVLEARCEYFRAMFRSGMAESFPAGSRTVDVVVPGECCPSLPLSLC